MNHRKSTVLYLLIMLPLVSYVLISCKSRNLSNSSKLFTLLDQKYTGITFVNQVNYTEEFNTYTYRNFYNGAGAGIGDINNDGLPDVYFCSNQAGNKLYLNKGNFRFEDITEKAGVSCQGSWSTGVSMVDINGDGWLDIYVCKSGKPQGNNRHNQAFINNRNLTFTDKSEEIGLAETGLSNHASFFDYDRDGDLDCYLLSNSFQSITDFDITSDQRSIRDTLGGNKLFRNDNGYFYNVSNEAGIYGSKIGFGLGVSAGDINRDGWMDIYVANDFFERDYLYINNRNGTFKECLEDYLYEISLGSMGADIADINNDACPEIFTTEMTPEGNSRRKTKALFESWDTYRQKLKKGYYQQFARNTLQLNNQNGSFSEIGRYSGVSYTDWSWGALIMDVDNDGWKDIFVANGIYKDLLDRDYLNLYSNPAIVRTMIATEEKAILKIIDMIPSVKVPNYLFHNNKDLTFTNNAALWGMDTPSFSNGSAYGDLDNDGDLDLVVNNVNMPPFVYRNETDNKSPKNFITLVLKGRGKNTFAIGAAVTIYCQGKMNYQELIPARGFQSWVDNRMVFGIGEASGIDSIKVQWPDGNCNTVFNPEINRQLILEEDRTRTACDTALKSSLPTVFSKIIIPQMPFTHKENDFQDFDRDRLIFQMISNQGPHVAVADVNNDNRDDLFLCNAKDAPAALLLQDKGKKFHLSNEDLFQKYKLSEETDCLFFDADNDGDKDLYVASGGNEYPLSSSALTDHLYLNDGKGNFSVTKQILPAGKYESTSCIAASDFDKDGDNDLFVGIRMLPFSYGLPVNGYLLENDGKGHFTNTSNKRAPGLKQLGMITDMVWADIDNDADEDMVIVGDWMPVKIFINENGMFTDASERLQLSKTSGWWNTIVAKDLNGDGRMDFVLGNHGLNTFFKSTEEKPLTMQVNDFDLNGTIEQIICMYYGDKSYPLVLKDDLIHQIPSLENKYKTYDDFKDQVMEDIFTPQVLSRSVILSSSVMATCAMINRGNGGFQLVPLPAETQFSPIYAILADDFDGDGICDILLGGNQFRAKPETGIFAATFGLFLKGKPEMKWEVIPPEKSGFFVWGEIRDFKMINIDGMRIIIVARNNDKPEFYEY